MPLTSQATFTAPGLCHNADLTGTPHAGTVTMRPDGTQQVPLDLGAVLGREAVLSVTDEDYLARLIDAALCAHSRLVMAHQDTPGRAA